MASAATGSWAVSPLTADTAGGGKAGSKARDYLPVRCVLGLGGLTTSIISMIPLEVLDDDETPEPCTVGCLCGLISDVGTITGSGCSAAGIMPGNIGATVVACKGIATPGVIGCLQ
ncbi:MAG: hypothetical protein LBK47_05285 [Prevotellaceae bacterium]|nr:hypothetical protein [Prevotellaceae bacterium]